MPYGSRGHVLTRAERKEYAPIVPPDKVVLPTAKRPPEQTPSLQNLTQVRCSVIQRTPKTSKRDDDTEIRLPTTVVMQEPEQDQPIDYHIPRRKGETEDENEERKNREQRRSHCHKVSKPLISVRAIVGKLPLTVSAAAGHSRAGGNTQNGGNQQSGGSTGGGGSINFTGSGNGGGSGGTLGGSGGTGGGGMNPGRDGRQNYGPSSPPTGSLPPFYESLKGGNNNANNYNANGSFASNGYGLMGGGPQGMDCDTGQDMSTMNLHGGQSPPKQYSTLQNASYGLVMKDEIDLDIYETKIDSIGSLLPGSYAGYDDAMMVDMATGAVVDPLQFTATLTFSSSAEHALLESLSDAADLSTFLQRLPNESNDSEEMMGDMHSPSITPESGPQQLVDQSIESQFQEHMIGRGYDAQRGFTQQPLSKLHQLDGVPSYPGAMGGEQMQMHPQQQMLSPSLSFNGNGLDLDSPTTMSLPSPGGASCSLDGNNHTDAGSLSPPANVSGRRDSASSESPALRGRVNVLQQRVSNKLIQAKQAYTACQSTLPQ